MSIKKSYESVDELISCQNTKIDELKRVVSLISDHKYVHDRIETVFGLIHKINANLCVLREESDCAKQLIMQAEDCEQSSNNLDRKICYIKQNVPYNFGKLYISENVTLENTINERTSTPVYNSGARRQINFIDSMCSSARKPVQNNNVEMLHLTQSQFESIPGYMRGRVTYDTLTAFISKINSCIQEKYRILNVPKGDLKKQADIDRYKLYKTQECAETKGKRFFTQDDLKTVLYGKVDKASLNFLTMLRHTKHIKEVREAGLLRYLIDS